MEIIIDSPEEGRRRAELTRRTDANAARLRRFLEKPDLSRLTESPIAQLAERIKELPDFKDFDILKVPEIVSVKESFDLFDFPTDHPARSPSDTYYLDENHLLRTHTTIMWYYHLRLPTVKEKLRQGKPVGALSYGKVYRKDEIDRNHLNIFHQMDGWLLVPRAEKIIGRADLEAVLVKIAEAIFGAGVNYRFNPDAFPYTEPSLEMEIEISGRWVEVLGAGVVKSKVLENLGTDPERYNGWAFGFGLERLAILSLDLPDIRLLWSNDARVKRQLKLGQKYKAVSKYPAISRDISFVVANPFVPNNYFDLIRDLGGDLIEEVKLLDQYRNTGKFGPGQVSYTYRMVYRSLERTLNTAEVEPLQRRIEEETVRQFGAKIR